MDSIGDKIYRLRKKLKLSQEQFAEKINVSRQIVSQWENNASKPKFDKIELICKTFNIDTNYFIDEKSRAEESAVDIAEIIEEPEEHNQKEPDQAEPMENAAAKSNYLSVKKALLIALMVVSAIIFLAVFSLIMYLTFCTVDVRGMFFEVVSSHIAVVSDDTLFWAVFVTELLLLFVFVYALNKFLKLVKAGAVK